MHFFDYKNGQLHVEDIPIAQIVRKVGTPAYVYSYGTIERHFRVFDRAFSNVPHLTCFSCKANSNLAILKVLARLGSGADIVSGGELYIALHASIPPEKIVFSGVGKTAAELRYAIDAGIAMINIESEGELGTISRLGRRMGKKVPVSIRVNPEIDPKTHPYITTGLRRNKFGILWEEARRLYGQIASDPNVTPVGISSHIGSQIVEIPPFVDAVRSLKAMIAELADAGIHLTYVDIGGGLGIVYKKELPPHPEDYAQAVEKEVMGMGLTLVLEPGRVIIGNSGILVTKLLHVKKTAEKTFYIVDGAMNDLVRPALYDAYHEIVPVREVKGEQGRKVDVVGPVCESGDFFARDRKLPPLQPGDLVAIMGAGAYGFSMSSNYNSRRKVPEILVRGSDFFIVRKRETKHDLLRGQIVPKFLEV